MKRSALKYKKINDFDLVIEFLLSNFSSPTHWPEWNILVSKYYNTLFYYLGLFENDQLTGICPVHETKSGLLKNLRSGQFHFIPNGGWLASKRLQIDPSHIPIPFNSRFECFALPLLEDFGVKYSQVVKTFQTLVIDLKKSEDEIWSESINSKRRNMIRKAQKTGVTIKKNEGTINEFYSIYKESNQLNRIENLPFHFFTELIDGECNVHFLPLVSFYRGEPSGVLGLIYDKDYAFYWLGGTKANSVNSGQGELLQWEAIRYSKAIGCKYYDLCYVEKDRLPSVYEFKKGFSKTEIEIPYLVRKIFLFRIFNRLMN